MEERIRLLLADADENYRALLKDFLETSGFEILAAVGNGMEALHAAQQKKPQVVLMELILPGLEGMGLLEHLRREQCAPQVLILSQWTRKDAVREALERGAAYFIPKPCDLPALLGRIRAAVSYGADIPPEDNGELQAKRLIAQTLYDLGLSPSSSGTDLAQAMVQILLRNPEAIRQIDHALYRPFLQQGRRDTGYIEHALRYAIREAWTKNATEFQSELFRNTVRRESGSPSNGVFLAVVAEYVRMQLHHQDRQCSALL